MRRHYTFRTVINFISYMALIAIALSLVVVYVLKAGAVANVFNMIVQLLAYAIVIAVSFGYAKSKRSYVYMGIWFVASALLVTMFFLI